MSSLRFVSGLVPAAKSYQHWADTWIRSGWRVQANVVTGQSRLLDPRGRRVLTDTYENCRDFATRQAAQAGRRRAVVLLHGMGRTARPFIRLAADFEAQGLAVANMTYASLSAAPEHHLRSLEAIIAALAEDGAEEISFVGHSFGGMLIRQTLAGPLPVALGRAMLLGTPNQGSRLGRSLSHLSVYKSVFGAAGQAVLPDAASALPVGAGQIAVIAGGNGGRGYNPFLPGDNDGLVMVEEARLPGAPLMLVPCLHTFLPSDPRVRRMVVDFIG